jgi:hypothetical protein
MSRCGEKKKDYVFATRPRMGDTHDSDRREEEAWVE